MPDRSLDDGVVPGPVSEETVEPATREDPPSTVETLRLAWRILLPRDRKRWLVLLPLGIVAALVETGAAASIYALLGLLSAPDRAMTLPGLGDAVALLGETPSEQLTNVSLAVAVVYVAKNLVALFNQWALARASGLTAVSFGSRLLRAYMYVPYEFHKKINSGEQVRNLNAGVRLVVDNVYKGLFHLAIQAVVTISMTLLLVLASPSLFVVVAAMLLLQVAVFSRVLRRIFATWGAASHRLGGRAYSALAQALGGYREVKVLRAEKFFVGVFTWIKQEQARIQWRRHTLSLVPKFLLETLLVLGVAVAVLMFGRESSSFVAVLGLFAYVAYKTIPVAQQATQLVQQLQFNAVAIAEMSNHLERGRVAMAQSRKEEVPDEPVKTGVVFEGVTYRHEDARDDGRDDRGDNGSDGGGGVCGIDLEIRRGESIAFVGSSGAGKSTLLDLLLGLLPPQAGTIKVDGRTLGECRAWWYSRIGFVPQSVYLIDDTLRRNVALGERDEEIDDDRVSRAIEIAQLGPLVASLPDGLQTRLAEAGSRLSGGERQRVAIARAIYRARDVLILDEAMSALDNETDRALTEALGQLHGELTVVMVSHRLESLRAIDRIVLLDEGRIQGIGTYEALVGESASFRRLARAD